MFNNSRQFQIVEYVCLAGSVVGAVVATISGQVIYVAVPLCALALVSSIARRSFEVLTKQSTNAAIVRVQRQLSAEIQSLYASVRSLPPIPASIQDRNRQQQGHLSDEMQDYIASLVKVNVNAANRDIDRLKEQCATLQDSIGSVIQYLNNSSLSARVDHLEQSIAKISQGMGDVSYQFDAKLQKQLDELKQQVQLIKIEIASREKIRETVSLPNLESGSVQEPKCGSAGEELKITPISPSPHPPTLPSPQNLPAESWSCLKSFAGHSDWISSLVISSDGQKIASASFDGQIKLWDLPTGELIRVVSENAGVVYAIALNSDAEILASGSSDLSVKVWELQTGALIENFKEHSGSIRSVAISPDGTTLASGSFDQTIKIASLQTSKLINTLTGHQGAVSAIAFSPDGKILASGGGDGNIKFWHWNTGQLLHTLGGHLGAIGAVAFHPNGLLLASASTDKTIKLWNLTTLEKSGIFTGHLGAVTSVVFSPDRETLISSSADGTLKIWHWQTGKQICSLNTNSVASVISVAVSPNGKILVSGRVDGTIDIWQRN
ncbi:MAG TPA: hypothetical protein V6D28_27270 [Leptolyngbyaceae cyanobacterium]